MISFARKQQDSGAVVLDVVGEVDLQSAPELRGAISAALAGAAELRVDLSGVSFLDSTGVSALLAGHGEATGAGIPFAVANPQPQVLKVLRIVGLHELLGVTGTAERTD